MIAMPRLFTLKPKEQRKFTQPNQQIKFKQIQGSKQQVTYNRVNAYIEQNIHSG